MSATKKKEITLTYLLWFTPLWIGALAFEPFVLLKLYGWFLIPVGAPVMTYGQMWGLNLFVGLLRYSGMKPDDEEHWKLLARLIFASLWVWAFGALVHVVFA